MEIADTFMFINFGFGFELAGTKVAAFLVEIGVRLNGGDVRFGLSACFGRLRLLCGIVVRGGAIVFCFYAM